MPQQLQTGRLRWPLVRLRRALAGGCISLALAPTGWAHGLQHQTGRADAVVVRLQFHGVDDKPWGEPYEVFAPGQDQVHQRGVVNADGEIVFRPSVAGTWRVRMATDDGHGLDLDVAVDVVGQPQFEATLPAWQRVMTSLAWLFGLFGLWVLWRQQRQPQTPGVGAQVSVAPAAGPPRSD